MLHLNKSTPMRFTKNKSSNIYLPSSNKPDFQVGCKFQIEKFRSDGTITYKGPQFENTVLNCGLDGLTVYTVQSMILYCNVGTGSATPDITQTELSAFKIASTTLFGTLAITYNTDPIYIKWAKTFVFAIGTVTGNLTELGLSRLSNSAYFNRQLFKDLNGDPTVITVLEDEGIRVSVELFCYPGMLASDEVPGSFLINGNTTVNFIKKINIPAASTGFLATGTSSIGGGTTTSGTIGNLGLRGRAELSILTTGFAPGTIASSFVQEAYVAGSFERSCTYKWLAGTFIGTINSIFFNVTHVSTVGTIGNRLTGFYLTPGISKTSDEEITVTLKRTWGRYVAP